MNTLSIDIGGTNIKAAIVSGDGELVGDWIRCPTPRPAVPGSVHDALVALAAEQEFERVSIGFPGVVVDGVIYDAPNLDGDWSEIQMAEVIAKRVGRPVRMANDADVHGLGVIEGRGVEMVITLGTGMGAALYNNGALVPNFELGHHPFGDGETYEERIADSRLKQIGEAPWRLRVAETIAQVRPIWNFRHLYLGGGNARLIDASTLPDDVSLIDYDAGVRGAALLWL